ncbi:PREDICTED: uncharacterized protein LOC104726626 [Camelina sativa]|uniref:Uncharacterized protein LOC104726626 n=1 Tax=Camelina sativa TaxID=90675 RepID=A0ABM0UNP3_CAMSA|nr:PREDICTED: uncharacterized protein LOC104726626 [Camelina sativa]
MQALASIKNGSLREREVTHEKPIDKLMFKKSSVREKEVLLGETEEIIDENRDHILALGVLTAEQGLKSVAVNRTQAKQDSTQYQAKTIRGYKKIRRNQDEDITEHVG